MKRWTLITHEIVKDAYKGKFGKYWGKSIGESLELFFMQLQNQEEIKEETVPSFFTPMLTQNELQLVEEKNKNYFNTFEIHHYGRPTRHNPDVEPGKMAKSDSISKFVYGPCRRYTLPLRIESRKRKINQIN